MEISLIAVANKDVAAARKRSHQWCVSLTPNNTKTIVYIFIYISEVSVFLKTSVYIYIYIYLLLTAVPIISARLDQHPLFAGGNGLYVNVAC